MISEKHTRRYLNPEAAMSLAHFGGRRETGQSHRCFQIQNIDEDFPLILRYLFYRPKKNPGTGDRTAEVHVYGPKFRACSAIPDIRVSRFSQAGAGVNSAPSLQSETTIIE